MKTILSIPVPWFFVAVIIGVVLPILLSSSVFAPSPVNTPTQVVTPVPTPSPVYVEQPTAAQPTADAEEDETANQDNGFMVVFMLLGLPFAFALLIILLIIFDD